MAYNAIIGFLIQVESFRNINLSKQGAYFLSFKIFSDF